MLACYYTMRSSPDKRAFLLATPSAELGRSAHAERPTQPTIIARAAHSISRASISPQALKVLYRLKDAGYQAFLVGGSVRDLLLGAVPKDFDVATNALPEEIRRVFRNCRLIGRRFRLAHVHFGDEIIEVATFRAAAAPEEVDDDDHREVDDARAHDDSGRILRDNLYGTIDADVWRRDFTANALYYNIADFSVWDYVGGVEDVRARVLRLIGEPEVRYREDPVRLLRAARFAAKLGFTLHAETRAPTEALVDRRIEGRVHHCRLRPKPLQDATEWLMAQRAYWEARLDALEDYLLRRQGTGGKAVDLRKPEGK